MTVYSPETSGPLVDVRANIAMTRPAWLLTLARIFIERDHYGRADWYGNIGSYLDRGDKLTDALAKMAQILDRNRPPYALPNHFTVMMDDMIIRLEQRGPDGAEDTSTILHRWLPAREAMILTAVYANGLGSGPLATLARMTNEMAEWSSELTAAYRQPLIIGSFVYAGFYYASVKYIPDLFNSIPDLKLQGQALVFKESADFIVAYGFPLTAAIIALILGIRWTFANLTGNFRNKVLDRFPPWAWYKLHQGTAFFIAFGTLIQAKKSVIEALTDIQAQATPYVSENIGEILTHHDKDLASMFDASGRDWPSLQLNQALAHHGDGKNLAEDILSTGTKWMERHSRATKQKAKRASVITVVLTAIFAAWISKLATDLGASVVPF